MSIINPSDLGLGRLPAADERDAKFMMTAMITEPEKIIDRDYRYWSATGWWGDQQNTPQCVGYSWAHWIEDGPVTQKGAAPIIAPDVIYREAQKIDEWPGEGYDGTSVRAGAKVLQTLGFIQSYYWAWDAQTIGDAILSKGPVVVGTNWYYDMFFPDKEFIIKPTGKLSGGHAYLLNGFNKKTGLFRIKNSWGNGKTPNGNIWGKKGHAYISIESLDKLIKEDGEACLAIENKIQK